MYELAECIFEHSKQIKCFVPINKSRWGGRRVRYAGERGGENEVWRRGEAGREVDWATDWTTERSTERSNYRLNDRSNDRAIDRAIERPSDRLVWYRETIKTKKKPSGAYRRQEYQIVGWERWKKNTPFWQATDPVCLVRCLIKAVPKHKQFCDCQPGWKLRRVVKNIQKQMKINENAMLRNRRFRTIS